MSLSLTVLLASLFAPTAEAGSCDSFLKKANGAEGAAVVDAWIGMHRCNADEANNAFFEFVKASGDSDTLSALTLAAVDRKSFTAVWNMIEKVPDYEARDDVAYNLGKACADHDQVIPFLQGAFYGLRAIQFSQWKGSLVSCEAPELTDWMKEQVAKPPSASYDDKYTALVNAFVDKVGADALPTLKDAAIAADGNGGPFNSLIEAMDASVQPKGIGASVSDADKAKLEENLVAVANEVGPEKAVLVADRLYNSGAEAAAASLLPRIYPDKVQSGGGLLYGVAAIENCDKQAYFHVYEVSEPAKRWSILGDIEEPARGAKKKLKCDTDGPWTVVATSTPVKDGGEVDAWVTEISGQWEAKGFSVKTKKEKGISLP